MEEKPAYKKTKCDVCLCTLPGPGGIHVCSTTKLKERIESLLNDLADKELHRSVTHDEWQEAEADLRKAETRIKALENQLKKVYDDIEHGKAM